jgi:hypothetical protein
MVMPLIVKTPVESISNASAELPDASQPNIAADPESRVEAISNCCDAGTTVEDVRKEHSNIKTDRSVLINSITRVIVKQGVLDNVQSVILSSPGGECAIIIKKNLSHNRGKLPKTVHSFIIYTHSQKSNQTLRHKLWGVEHNGVNNDYNHSMARKS